MCGINGISWEDKQLVEEMNKRIAFRGPDNSSVTQLKNATLGHLRLSIIDLDVRSNQPLSYIHKGKEYWIVYNGEIYNYKEIKKDLEDKGYIFKTQSDTEVVLVGYIEYGEKIVEKLNGMWAFCIYDGKKFFCSRDRFGKKPLYYFYDKNTKRFAFSSQISPLYLIQSNKKINKKSVNLYFSLGFIPSPYTIMENIYKLKPGHNLIFDKNEIKINQYYFLPTSKYEKDTEHLKRKIKDIIKDSLKIRIQNSDVPVGLFLSSGLDSSFLCALAREIDPNIQTFTIRFHHIEHDESRDVIKWVDNANIIDFKENYNELMETFIKAFDEPFADISAFPLLILSKEARKQVKVVISGDGGDEVFGGYEIYRAFLISKLFSKIPVIDVLASKIQKLTQEYSFLWKVMEIIRLSKKPLNEWLCSFLEDIKYLSEEYKEWVKLNYDSIKYTSDNELERFINFDIMFRTLGDNYLTKVDRSSMFYGLEVRCPYLDYRLINISKTIPPHKKMGILKNKILFREIVKDVLPKHLMKLNKKGFKPPLKEFLKDKDEELKKMLKELKEKDIISEKVYEFYVTKVFTQNHEISLINRMRLYILYKWYKYWMSNV